VSEYHLLSDEIDQQQGRVAFRAVAAQANGAAKEMAVGQGHGPLAAFEQAFMGNTADGGVECRNLVC
jgi:hypothetical protein